MEKLVYLLFQNLEPVDISVRKRNTKETYMSAASCAFDGILEGYLGTQMIVQCENLEQNTLNGRFVIKEYMSKMSKHLELLFVKQKHLDVGSVIPFPLKLSLFFHPEQRSQ